MLPLLPDIATRQSADTTIRLCHHAVPQLRWVSFSATGKLDDPDGDHFPRGGIAIDVECVAYLVECRGHRLDILRAERRGTITHELDYRTHH